MAPVDRGVPLPGQRGQQRQRVATAVADGHVDILERPFERELGRVVARRPGIFKNGPQW